MAKKRLEYTDAKSSKFWEVNVRRKTITVTYGKIGTKGQTKERELDSEAAAKAEMAKLIASKIKKGYAEVGAESESAQEETSISREQARDLVNGKCGAFDERAKRMLGCGFGDGKDSAVDFFSGQTSFDDYEVFDVTLVDGDLRVRGLLTDAANDHSLLIVLGDLRVQRAVICSEIIVTGSLVIDEEAAFDSMGDYKLSVGGNVTAKGLIESDHGMDVRGEWKLERCFERGQEASEILDEECLDEDGYHLFSEIAGRIREGSSAFK